jgi:glutamine synthetase type III
MANLNYIHTDEEDPLYSYYVTLCHVYYFHVGENDSEKEKQQAEATIETISSLIFHAINIEGTTIREMDNEQYVREFKRFYNDIIEAIQECCKNEVDYDVFLEIIDEIIGAARKIATALHKLQSIKVESAEGSTTESDEDNEMEEE